MSIFFFFFNDTATTEIYTNLNTLSLHDALPIPPTSAARAVRTSAPSPPPRPTSTRSEEHTSELQSHSEISYAVFCLKTKKYQKSAHAFNRRPWAHRIHNLGYISP